MRHITGWIWILRIDWILRIYQTIHSFTCSHLQNRSAKVKRLGFMTQGFNKITSTLFEPFSISLNFESNSAVPIPILGSIPGFILVFSSGFHPAFHRNSYPSPFHTYTSNNLNSYRTSSFSFNPRFHSRLHSMLRIESWRYRWSIPN